MNKWNMLVVNEKLSQSMCLAPTPEKIKEYELYKKHFNELYEEIERLNNIINGIEEHLKSEIKIGNKVWSETQNKEERMQTGLIKNTLELTLDKLQELKGENK